MSVTFHSVVSFAAPFITLLLAYPMVKEGDKKGTVIYLLLLAAAVGLTEYLKLVFEVPRPEGALVAETGYAFPSSHATIGLFPLGFYLDRASEKRLVSLALYGILVSYSRVALRVHRPEEVVVGGLIGIAVPYLVLRWEEEIRGLDWL